MSDRYKVVRRTVGTGGGGMSYNHRIVDTEHGRTVDLSLRNTLTFLWEDDAENFCAAMNLGQRSRSLKVEEGDEQADRLFSISEKYDEEELGSLHDVLTEVERTDTGIAIVPSYKLIREILLFDRDLLMMVFQWGPSDTEVRDKMFTNLKSGKYDEVL